MHKAYQFGALGQSSKPIKRQKHALCKIKTNFFHLKERNTLLKVSKLNLLLGYEDVLPSHKVFPNTKV